MNLKLTDQTAVVAASSKGLGYAVARQIAAEGANVTVCSRSKKRAKKAAKNIISETDAGTDSVLGIACDLTETEDITALIKRTVDNFGGIDILVANHGGPPSVGFEESTEKQWENAYTSIISSTRWLIEAALPYLKESNLGSLAVVTSTSAQESTTNDVFSNVFRLALYGLAKTISCEYAPDIRSNVVAPRFIMTDRVQYKVEQRAERRNISIDEAQQSRVDEVAFNRPGKPSEFADAVTFVVSPRASYITGEVLNVDGGWSRHVL